MGHTFKSPYGDYWNFNNGQSLVSEPTEKPFKSPYGDYWNFN